MKSLLALFLLTTCCISCSNLNPKADQVALINNERPDRCVEVGEIKARNSSYEKALVDLKTMAFDLGGRAIQINKETRETFTITLEGKAYRCD